MHASVFPALLLYKSLRAPVLLRRVCRPERLHGYRTDSIPALGVCSRGECTRAAPAHHSPSRAIRHPRRTPLVRQFLLQRIGEHRGCTLVASGQRIPSVTPAPSHELLPATIRMSYFQTLLHSEMRRPKYASCSKWCPAPSFHFLALLMVSIMPDSR